MCIEKNGVRWGGVFVLVKTAEEYKLDGLKGVLGLSWWVGVGWDGRWGVGFYTYAGLGFGMVWGVEFEGVGVGFVGC